MGIQTFIFQLFKQIDDYFSLIIQIKTMKKQQVWTYQEDQILAKLYQEVGCFQRWKFINAKLNQKGIQKSQFQCRERYINHLIPGLKVGKLDKSEIVKLFECYDEHGPKWSFFETKVRGRSQIMLKNQFYSTLRSLLRLLIKISQKLNIYLQRIESANYSSKLLTDLYEGKKSFLKQKNFFKNCLKNIGYSVEKQLLQNYLKMVDRDQLELFFTTLSEELGRKQTKRESEKQIKDKKDKKDDKKREKRQRFESKTIQIEQKQEKEGEDSFIYKIPPVTVNPEDNQIKNSFWEYNFYPMIPLTDQYSILGQEYVCSFYYYPC